MSIETMTEQDIVRERQHLKNVTFLWRYSSIAPEKWPAHAKRDFAALLALDEEIKRRRSEAR